MPAESPTHRPRIDFDPGLPISVHVAEIAQLIADHQVVVIAGETGSGKTTQLPKICLLAGRRRIGHTQPRRIAARSVATRIAAELGGELGDLVGYQVRFTRQASSQTRIKVMTDGILLAEIGHDRELRRYDTIIIDEAHERSLNIDFLLGYLKQLLNHRPELRVIITSATIDTARFAAHFGQAPVVQVSGRSHPVEVRYRPLIDPDQPEAEPLDQAEGIVAAVAELRAAGPGDILVFCSGEREIRDALDALAEQHQPDTELVGLHSRLSAAEQQRIFAPHAGRRIVVATNIAETSLTVPGIRYVVDAGTARISRYSARTKVQRLPIEPISRASADQRAGRCGRVAPGIAIRLYSEADYLARDEFTEPEILRTNLAAVILQMAKAGLGDIADFPFVEAPDVAQIGDGLRLLTELGALRERKPIRLTRIGRDLAGLPIDPRLGRMLIEANHRGCLREMLVIASFLAIQDVRERPAEHREQADRLHARFFSDAALAAATQPASDGAAKEPNAASSSRDNRHTERPAAGSKPGPEPLRHTPHTSKTARIQGLRGNPEDQPATSIDPGGDITAILRLWGYLQTERLTRSGNQFRRLCRDEYLSFLRVREWQDLHTQLKQLCKDLGMRRNATAAPTDQVLISALSGLLSQIGLQQPPPPNAPGGRGRRRRTMTEFQGTRGARFAIQPGSALARRPPQLVMAVELVKTARLWARTVAAIEPEWLEQVGAHLLKRTYSEPHWSVSSSRVVARERVLLFGLPVIVDRLIDYGRIDSQAAREIFIRAGLVEGQWRPTGPHANHGFLKHNAEVLRQVEEIADRTRRRQVTIDDQVIHDFYDRRLPSTVCSQSSFDAWWREYPDPGFLEFDLGLLIDGDALDRVRREFPDRWSIAGLNLPIGYVFEPGTQQDGVSIRVPMAQLNQLRPEPFSWQVPGLRLELAEELIRSLPKQSRTRFVPAPDHASAAVRWLAANRANRSRRFCDELGRALTALTGESVPVDHWHPEQVPTHLQVGFEVTQPGRPTRFSRDLGELRAELSQQVSRTITRAAPEVSKSTSWTFGELAEQVTIRHGGLQVVGYPALKDLGDGVSVILAETPAQQMASHGLGIRRLLVLTNPDPTRWAISQLTNSQKLALPGGPYPAVPTLLADARLKAVDQCARRHREPSSIRDAAAYDRLGVAVRQEQADQMRKVVAVAAEVCELTGQVQALAETSVIGPEILDQLDNLVFRGFIGFTRDPWYEQLPRYLKAMLARMRQAAGDPARDARLAAPIAELQAEYDALRADQPPGRLPDAMDDVGFWIEELRVQAHAQILGTVLSVSTKRIRRALAELA